MSDNIREELLRLFAEQESWATKFDHPPDDDVAVAVREQAIAEAKRLQAALHHVPDRLLPLILSAYLLGKMIGAIDLCLFTEPIRAGERHLLGKESERDAKRKKLSAKYAKLWERAEELRADGMSKQRLCEQLIEEGHGYTDWRSVNAALGRVEKIIGKSLTNGKRVRKKNSSR